MYNNFHRRLGFQDYLLREFKNYLVKFSKIRGSGKSGLYFIHSGKQEVILRSGCEVVDNKIILRFFCGLPSFGRKIAGKYAIEMLTKEIPSSIKILRFSTHNKEKIYDFVNLIEDIEFIRNQLEKRKLVAFIGNDAILPRRSGIEETPLLKNPIKFKSPPSLEVEFETLHHGKIKGMGIPEGVTLIIGGGFHGKSTLLNAISKGIYPHIKGDGREWVITHPEAVKVRSEDGRTITGVDISPFIKNLPMGKSTDFFSTENASGSTSIAANIIEALEVGAKVLLLDEDTTATNFLIRDALIQKLIPSEKEPITPFIDKVKNLYKDYNVSTIIVIGGCGDYFAVADNVISLENYKIFDKTKEAKKIIDQFDYKREGENKNFGRINQRIPSFSSIDFKEKFKIRGKNEIIIKRKSIDLSAIEQIMEENQLKFIASALKYLIKLQMKEKVHLNELLNIFENEFRKNGFKLFNKEPSGDLTFIRKIEIACAINRIRGVKIIDS